MVWNLQKNLIFPSACFPSVRKKNFDVRVYTPHALSTIKKREITAGDLHGHIEMFFNGKWYSDFKSPVSSWNNGNSIYKSKKFFRFSDCKGQDIVFNNIIDFISSGPISTANAGDEISNVSEEKIPAYKSIVIASNDGIVNNVNKLKFYSSADPSRSSTSAALTFSKYSFVE